MQALSFGRSSLAQTALISVLTLAALAVLGAVLAYWTWAWFAPRAEPRVEAAAQSGDVAAAATIFGTVPRKQAAAPTGIAIKLFGVVAASAGRRGYAVLQLEAKDIRAVHEGEDISPGVRLAEVLADHVILERNGVGETLALPERKGSAPAAAQAAASSQAAAAAQAAAQRVGKAGGRNKDEE